MDKPGPPRRALIVHAGAWAIPDAEKEAHLAGCREATKAGWAVLAEGGTALRAVRAAVRSMEDDRTLNAGAGSVLCHDGHVELDAGIMCGATLDVGAVAALRDRANPIEAAASVLESPYVILVGKGAAQILAERGIPACDPADLVEQREVLRLQQVLERRAGTGAAFGEEEDDLPGDTVGAVAVDRFGNVAAGSSTGGTCAKPPGRMGDTPVPGAGFFADNLSAGASCTGWGEGILRMGMARRAVDLARENNAVDATWLAVRELEDRYHGRGGVVLIARDGSIGYAFNTPSMAYGYMDEELAVPEVGGAK